MPDAVKTALFKPIIPREGIVNSRCIRSSCFHHRHFTLALGYHIDDTAGTFFRQIDRQLFDRFAFLTVDFLDNDLRLTNLQSTTYDAWFRSGQTSGEHRVHTPTKNRQNLSEPLARQGSCPVLSSNDHIYGEMSRTCHLSRKTESY